MALEDRLGGRDAQPVADGGVDPERHPCPQAVVDHRGDERPLSRHHHLLLDHGGDDQDVVRGQVPRAGVAHVHLRQFRPKACNWRSASCLDVVLFGEVVGGREEEALQMRRLGVLEVVREPAHTLRVAQVGPGPEPGRDARSSSAIWFTSAIRSAISSRVKPSGKTIRRSARPPSVVVVVAAVVVVSSAGVPGSPSPPANANAIAASRPKPASTPTSAATRRPGAREPRSPPYTGRPLFHCR